MATSVSELISALSEKRRMMEELLIHLKEEQRCIVACDLTNLEIEVAKKKELIVQLETSSNLSRQLVKQMALELNVPEASSLSPLLPKVAAPHRETLQGLQRRLIELGGTLDGVLVSNGELLQGALRTVTRSLEYFGRLFNRSTTYGEAGKMVGAAADARIICKEI